MSNFNLDIFLREMDEKLSNFGGSNTLTINEQFEKIVKTLKDVIDRLAPGQKSTKYINRYQYSKVGNAKLSMLNVDCGVSKDSSLGPLLFLLYVNNHPLASEFSSTLFADLHAFNVIREKPVKSRKKSQHSFKKNRILIEKNKLSLNYSKAAYPLFNK